MVCDIFGQALIPVAELVSCFFLVFALSLKERLTNRLGCL